MLVVSDVLIFCLVLLYCQFILNIAFCYFLKNMISSSVLWNPTGDSDSILTIADHFIDVWTVENGAAQVWDAI